MNETNDNACTETCRSRNRQPVGGGSGGNLTA